jgi:hypothetical protein
LMDKLTEDIIVMLVCMIFIVSARLFLRARDRKVAEAEDGVLMRNTSGVQV